MSQTAEIRTSPEGHAQREPRARAVRFLFSAYDNMGNRTRYNGAAGYAYTAANRIQADGEFGYAHDMNGNLTEKKLGGAREQGEAGAEGTRGHVVELRQ